MRLVPAYCVGKDKARRLAPYGSSKNHRVHYARIQ
jgi:hypothetical protein